MIKSATAVWKGSNIDGTGTVSTQSKILQNVFFTKVKDVTDQFGTNEFELLAAALSISFTNLLGELLLKDGYEYELIEANMELTVFREITQANLFVNIKASTIKKAQLILLIENAKNRCPISKTFTISINCKLI